MKKLLLVSALGLATCVTMYSCNNGAYDATPNQDLSSAVNPLNPNSGISIHVGSMQGVVNNKHYVFSPAFWFLDTNGVDQHLIARVKDDTVFHRTLRVDFTNYDGAKMYLTNDTFGIDPSVRFIMLDTSRVDLAGRKIYNTYSPITGGKGPVVFYSEFKVEGDEGGNYRGHMSGYLMRTAPEKQISDTIRMQNIEFYFEKQSWPLPSEYVEYLYN